MRMMPEFLKNDEWYVETPDAEDGRGFHLTDKAPESAIASYEAFYSEPDVDLIGNKNGLNLNHIVF